MRQINRKRPRRRLMVKYVTRRSRADENSVFGKVGLARIIRGRQRAANIARRLPTGTIKRKLGRPRFLRIRGDPLSIIPPVRTSVIRAIRRSRKSSDASPGAAPNGRYERAYSRSETNGTTFSCRTRKERVSPPTHPVRAL